MFEIELKCPVEEFEAIRARLQDRGATADGEIDEADHYFNAPDRDFARTDEALRIRRVGNSNRLTYKGPKQAGTAKTRREIEVALADGRQVADDFASLLQALGYRPTAVVRKRRQAYRLQRKSFDIGVCLDEVEQVGRFVEVEILAPEGQKKVAEEVLHQLCKELGLTQFERRSYLEMLLEKTGRL